MPSHVLSFPQVSPITNVGDKVSGNPESLMIEKPDGGGSMRTPHPYPLPQGERGIEALWRRSNVVSPDYYCRGQALQAFLDSPLSFPQVFSGNPDFIL